MSSFIRVGHLGALALGVALHASFAGAAEIELSVTVAPPPLPVYEQPPVPAPGYIWTPGYWSYGPDGYFWVPGTWVEAPEVGLVWTPGYWGWSDGVYVWYDGYWGPQIGFYGGVNYGFGYPGHGYEGGYWQGNEFFYNRAVNRVNGAEIRNVYSKAVVNVTVNNIRYNGGPGGVIAGPTAPELSAAREPHHAATAMQSQHRASASSRHELLGSVNQGKPQIAATAKPNDFSGRGVVRASGAGTPNGRAPNGAGVIHEARAPVHAGDLPPATPPALVSSGNSPRDQEYQRQQASGRRNISTSARHCSRSRRRITLGSRRAVARELRHLTSSRGSISNRRNSCNSVTPPSSRNCRSPSRAHTPPPRRTQGKNPGKTRNENRGPAQP